jgi:hypothetical protein
MPYTLAERFIPGFKVSGMPIRMASMVQLSAAVLAAVGIRELARTLLRPWAARVLFSCAFVIEILPIPIPTTPPYAPDYVQALAGLPPGAVFGLDEIDYSLALYHQTIIGKPINGGLVSRRPGACIERYDRMKRLFAEGRIPEFLAASQARFVVSPTLPAGTAPPRGLEVLFAGERYSVLAAAGDPLVHGAASRPAGAPPAADGGAGEAPAVWDDPGGARLGRGWYPPETEPGPRRFHWTGPRAEFELGPRSEASAVKVRLLGRPLPTTVTLTVNGVALPQKRQEAGQEIVLTFALPHPARAGETLACALEAEPFTPRSLDPTTPDDRQLGLRVAEIRLE